jgi:hypothetical protein
LILTTTTEKLTLALFNELKRRNVFRVGAAYVVVAWLLIQLTETIFPLFGFDDTPARIVVIVLAIGEVEILTDSEMDTVMEKFDSYRVQD